jgi:hypothetical protein
MPGPPQYGGAPVTNIRNISSPHWRGWLGCKNRCVVPATSFASTPAPSEDDAGLVRPERRPRVFAFAGLRTRWRGVRGPKSAPIEGEYLFGVLTTEANATVAPVHLAQPVRALTEKLVDGGFDVVERICNGSKHRGNSRDQFLFVPGAEDVISPSGVSAVDGVAFAGAVHPDCWSNTRDIRCWSTFVFAGSWAPSHSFSVSTFRGWTLSDTVRACRVGKETPPEQKEG